MHLTTLTEVCDIPHICFSRRTAKCYSHNLYRAFFLITHSIFPLITQFGDSGEKLGRTTEKEECQSLWYQAWKMWAQAGNHTPLLFFFSREVQTPDFSLADLANNMLCYS
jgi:hypothetical protein